MSTPTSIAEGMTCVAASRLVGVHYNTIYAWIRDGHLPVSRFGPQGRIVRISHEDLVATAAKFGRTVQTNDTGDAA